MSLTKNLKVLNQASRASANRFKS